MADIVTIRIDGMRCGHSVAAAERALAIGDAGFTATLDEQPAPKHEAASVCCCSGDTPSTVALSKRAS